MPWKKGQSGNPAGNPGKKRALTEILEKTGNRTVLVDDKKIARKRLLARMAWDIATFGKATFPDGTELVLSPDDWLQMFKFLYQQIDGAPKQEMDLTSMGEKLVQVEYVNTPYYITDLPPGTISDSAEPEKV